MQRILEHRKYACLMVVIFEPQHQEIFRGQLPGPCLALDLLMLAQPYYHADGFQIQPGIVYYDELFVMRMRVEHYARDPATGTAGNRVSVTRFLRKGDGAYKIYCDVASGGSFVAELKWANGAYAVEAKKAGVPRTRFFPAPADLYIPAEILKLAEDVTQPFYNHDRNPEIEDAFNKWMKTLLKDAADQGVLDRMPEKERADILNLSTNMQLFQWSRDEGSAIEPLCAALAEIAKKKPHLRNGIAKICCAIGEIYYSYRHDERRRFLSFPRSEPFFKLAKELCPAEEKYLINWVLVLVRTNRQLAISELDALLEKGRADSIPMKLFRIKIDADLRTVHDKLDRIERGALAQQETFVALEEDLAAARSLITTSRFSGDPNALSLRGNVYYESARLHFYRYKHILRNGGKKKEEEAHPLAMAVFDEMADSAVSLRKAYTLALATAMESKKRHRESERFTGRVRENDEWRRTGQLDHALNMLTDYMSDRFISSMLSSFWREALDSRITVSEPRDFARIKSGAEKLRAACESIPWAKLKGEGFIEENSNDRQASFKAGSKNIMEILGQGNMGCWLAAQEKAYNSFGGLLKESNWDGKEEASTALAYVEELAKDNEQDGRFKEAAAKVVKYLWENKYKIDRLHLAILKILTDPSNAQSTGIMRGWLYDEIRTSPYNVFPAGAEGKSMDETSKERAFESHLEFIEKILNIEIKESDEEEGLPDELKNASKRTFSFQELWAYSKRPAWGDWRVRRRVVEKITKLKREGAAEKIVTDLCNTDPSCAVALAAMGCLVYWTGNGFARQLPVYRAILDKDSESLKEQFDRAPDARKLVVAALRRALKDPDIAVGSFAAERIGAMRIMEFEDDLKLMIKEYLPSKLRLSAAMALGSLKPVESRLLQAAAGANGSEDSPASFTRRTASLGDKLNVAKGWKETVVPAEEKISKIEELMEDAEAALQRYAEKQESGLYYYIDATLARADGIAQVFIDSAKERVSHEIGLIESRIGEEQRLAGEMAYFLNDAIAGVRNAASSMEGTIDMLEWQNIWDTIQPVHHESFQRDCQAVESKLEELSRLREIVATYNEMWMDIEMFCREIFELGDVLGNKELFREEKCSATHFRDKIFSDHMVKLETFNSLPADTRTACARIKDKTLFVRRLKGIVEGMKRRCDPEVPQELKELLPVLRRALQPMPLGRDIFACDTSGKLAPMSKNDEEAACKDLEKAASLVLLFEGHSLSQAVLIMRLELTQKMFPASRLSDLRAKISRLEQGLALTKQKIDGIDITAPGTGEGLKQIGDRLNESDTEINDMAMEIERVWAENIRSQVAVFNRTVRVWLEDWVGPELGADGVKDFTIAMDRLETSLSALSAVSAKSPEDYRRLKEACFVRFDEVIKRYLRDNFIAHPFKDLMRNLDEFTHSMKDIILLMRFGVLGRAIGKTWTSLKIVSGPDGKTEDIEIYKLFPSFTEVPECPAILRMSLMKQGVDRYSINFDQLLELVNYMFNAGMPGVKRQPFCVIPEGGLEDTMRDMGKGLEGGAGMIAVYKMNEIRAMKKELERILERQNVITVSRKPGHEGIIISPRLMLYFLRDTYALYAGMNIRNTEATFPGGGIDPELVVRTLALDWGKNSASPHISAGVKGYPGALGGIEAALRDDGVNTGQQRELLKAAKTIQDSVGSDRDIGIFKDSLLALLRVTGGAAKAPEPAPAEPQGSVPAPALQAAPSPRTQSAYGGVYYDPKRLKFEIRGEEAGAGSVELCAALDAARVKLLGIGAWGPRLTKILSRLSGGPAINIEVVKDLKADSFFNGETVQFDMAFLQFMIGKIKEGHPAALFIYAERRMHELGHASMAGDDLDEAEEETILIEEHMALLEAAYTALPSLRGEIEQLTDITLQAGDVTDKFSHVFNTKELFKNIHRWLEMKKTLPPERYGEIRAEIKAFAAKAIEQLRKTRAPRGKAFPAVNIPPAYSEGLSQALLLLSALKDADTEILNDICRIYPDVEAMPKARRILISSSLIPDCQRGLIEKINAESARAVKAGYTREQIEIKPLSYIQNAKPEAGIEVAVLLTETDGTLYKGNGKKLIFGRDGNSPVYINGLVAAGRALLNRDAVKLMRVLTLLAGPEGMNPGMRVGLMQEYIDAGNIEEIAKCLKIRLPALGIASKDINVFNRMLLETMQYA